MADNVAITAGSGTTIATDDVGGAHYQRVKPDFGGDGVSVPPDTNSGNKSSGTQRVVLATDQPALTTPMPVSQKAATSTSGTLQNAVSATGNGSTLSVDGMAVAVFTVTGTFTATVDFEGTEDGSNWSSISVNKFGTSTLAVNTTSTGVYRAYCAGLVSVRARVTWTSGTSVTVTGHTVPVAPASHVQNVAQVGGTAIDTNSGNKSAGTQRVVIATDQPSLTTFGVQDTEKVADDGTFTVGTTKVMPAGGYVVAHGSNPDAADAGDAGAMLMNRHRVPFHIGGHPNIVTSSARRADADNGVTDGAIGPGTVAAGTKVVITRITVTCSNANTVNVACKVGFGASTLPGDSTTGAAGVLVDHEGIPPGGGFTIGDGSGILGIGADGEELRWTVDDPVGGHVICTVSYFTIES